MLRGPAVLFVIGLGVAAACGGSVGDNTAESSALWAQTADNHFLEIAESFCCEADFGSASYFVPGSVDFRMLGGPIATTPEEMAYSLSRYLRAPTGDRGQTVLDDLYLDVSGAIASYRLVGPDRPIRAWTVLYAIDDDAFTGRVYSSENAFGPAARTPFLLTGLDLYDRYLAAWSRPDAAAIADVYAADAIVLDTLTADRWSGRDEILAGIGDEDYGMLESGPWPRLSSYTVAGARELLAVVQTTGPCAAREARRWILVDGMIVEEIRYRHVPSVRRCRSDLTDDLTEGWWADFASPDAERAVSTVEIDIDGHVVRAVNGEPTQLEFVRWLLDRYRDGLNPPRVSAIWFPPSVDCTSEGSFARRRDERFEGRPSVTLCLNDDELAATAVGTRWLPSAARIGLHELAHVWLYDNLSVSDQVAFMQRTEVDSWRAEAWDQSGVEQAAETLAWGLSGDRYRTYEIEPRPACAELTARYELLTGRLPLTRCDENVGD